MKKISFKFFIREDYLLFNNERAIYIRFCYNRKKNDYSLNLSTKQIFWDINTQRIKKGDKDSDNKNLLIDNYANKANKFIFETRLRNESITFSDFKKAVFSDNYNRSSLYEFWAKEIEQLKPKFKPNTIRTLEFHLDKMKKFRKQILFGEIDLQLIRDYETFMISKLHNNKNTISKSMAVLKSIINKAIQANIIEKNVFEKYKITIIQGNREFLTIQELKILMVLYNSKELNPFLHNVLCYFLFSCFTGLRYGDIKKLKMKNITEQYIELKMEKTDKIIKIPYLNVAKIYLNEALQPENYVFNCLSNQATNRTLKDIMDIAGIEKSISFHCARHTFATLALSSDVQIETISDLLGHTDIKTTQIYTKVSNEKKIEAIQKIENKLASNSKIQ